MSKISKVDRHRSLLIEYRKIDKKLIARFLVIINFDRISMLLFDLIDFNRQVSEYERDAWQEIRLQSNAD